MGRKGFAIVAVLLAITPPAVTFAVQPSRPAAANRATQSSSTPADPSPQATPANSRGTESEGAAHEYTPPQITVTNPPATVAPWSWHEKIGWAADVVLAILGYVGIMLAVQLLKKIERQTQFVETAAGAAAASAHAALMNAQAIIHSERPWILISVEPSRSAENSFSVVATNRGRTPGTIIATLERIRIDIDEKHLPATPEYRNEKLGAPQVPIILLPGEFAAIKAFSREDVKALCDSEERFKRIETWEEKVFLYGRVIYQDLISASDDQVHETNWCCWYIHGRQTSGLVVAGKPEYNSHT